MKERIKVITSNEQEKLKIPKGLRMLVRRCCNAILQTEKVEGNVDVFIAFTDDDGFKNYPGSSNADVDGVLSLPSDEMNEGVRNLGRVVISLEAVEAHADRFSSTFKNEAAHLTVHGVLALLGYSYDDAAAKSKMREKEELIMELIGFPYSPSYVI